VDEALSKIGEIGYNLMWANCEHFAKFCRYGAPSSDQVRIPSFSFGGQLCTFARVLSLFGWVFSLFF